MNGTASRWFAALVPLWLLGLALPPSVTTENREVFQFISLVWLPIVGTASGGRLFLAGPVFRRQPSVAIWMAASITTLAMGALLSEYPLRALGYVTSAAVGLTCCAGLWRWIENNTDVWLGGFGLLGSAVAASLYFTWTPTAGARLSLSEAVHPNYLGLVSLAVLMASLALRRWPLIAAAIIVNLLTIVATQSRSSLVGACLGLLVYWVIRVRVIHRARAFVVLSCTVLFSVGLILIYREEISDLVSSLLFLNDKYRGFGTGFTGRTDAWAEALSLFFDNVWFGVGFRLQEDYMTTSLSSAHNGYLSLLAETGFLGTVSLVILMLSGACRLLYRALSGERAAAQGLGLLVGYLFVAIFERFFINMGNPTSMLVWLFLMIPARQRAPALPDLAAIRWHNCDDTVRSRIPA